MTFSLTADEARLYADAIVDAVPQSLLVLDADLRVLRANRTFYDTFRVEAADTERRPLVDLGGRPWNAPRLVELLRAVLVTNEPFDAFEVEADLRSLGPRVMLLSAHPIGPGPGRPALILLIIEDVTEPRRREKNVRRRQRIETIGLLGRRSRPRFQQPPHGHHRSGRDPAATTGRGQPPRRQPGRHPRHRPAGGRDDEAAARLQPPAGPCAARPRPGRGRAGPGASVRELGPRRRRADDVLTSSAIILADPGQLEHACSSTWSPTPSAAMPTGGRLLIETADTHLDDAFVRDHAGASAGPVVRLAIADTGVGMSAEVQSRIFEPFYTTKTKGHRPRPGHGVRGGRAERRIGLGRQHAGPGHDGQGVLPACLRASAGSTCAPATLR